MINSDRTEIRAYRQPWLSDAIAFHVTRIQVREGVRTVGLAETLVFRTLTQEDMARVQPETFNLTPEEAQQMIDELWRAGVRPTDGAGSVGQLAAISRHLEDMRTLVFKPKTP